MAAAGLAILACGQPAADAPRDTLVATTSPATVFPVGAYVSRGACPFECCMYGTWRLRTPALLRAAPATDGDSVALLPSRAAVRADSGVVVVHPVGLLVLTAPAPVPQLGDSLRAQVGDTIELLDYIGEGIRRVRLHGREMEVEEWWRYRDGRGARVLREPVQRWWVFMTDSASGQRGWVAMDSVRMDGADACG